MYLGFFKLYTRVFFFQYKVKLVTIIVHMIDLLSLGVGTITWSPLAGGILTGKYDDGVPIYSRAALKVAIKAHNVVIINAMSCKIYREEYM